MQIDVWSDVACPWCWIGRAQLMTALEQVEDVTFRWRSFELDPNAPERTEGDYVKKLADKYGRSRDQAQEMLDTMTDRGKTVGLDFDFANMRPGNTFKAHQLVHLAQEHGLQDAMKNALFEGYFSKGLCPSDPDTLVELAVGVGLPEEAVREALISGAYEKHVRSDEALARQLGVSGVPFFVFDQRVAVSGAQPTEVLLQAIAHARETAEPPEAGAGDSCGVDGVC